MGSYGTGTIYQRKRDGKWVVSIESGWTKTGTRKRRTRVVSSKREAQQARLAMLRESDATPTAPSTVKSWAETWLKLRVDKVRPASFATDRSAVRLWIIPTIGHKRLAQLTPADVRSVSRAALNAGRTPATAHRAHCLLHKLLKDAQLEGHAVPEHAMKTEAPPLGESGRNRIPRADLAAILAAVTTRHDGVRWAVSLLTGLRPAEVRGITWDALDLDAGLLTVRWQLKALPYVIARDPSSGFRVPIGYDCRHLVDAYHLVDVKTKKGRRVVPLAPWLVEQLRRWKVYAEPNPWGLSFTANKRPLNDAADRERWRKLCAEAGVPPHDLYACRHTLATEWREAGATDEALTATMGHTSILSSLPYLHQGPSAEIAALVAQRWGLSPVGELGWEPHRNYTP